MVLYALLKLGMYAEDIYMQDFTMGLCREQYLTGPIHHFMGLHWLKRQIQSSACSPHTSTCWITAEQCDIYVIKSTLTLRTDVLH